MLLKKDLRVIASSPDYGVEFGTAFVLDTKLARREGIARNRSLFVDMRFEKVDVTLPPIAQILKSFDSA